MSKSITAGMLAMLQTQEHTLAMCWKITRKDTTVLGFTSHVEPLTVDGVDYESAAGSFSGTSVRSTSDLSVDNLDLNVIFDSNAIQEVDLVSGKYDYAEVEVFLVDYTNLANDTIPVKYGFLGEVVADGGRFKAELRGLTQLLQQVLGRSYTKRCDANLGDTRCGVNLASYTATGSVASVGSRSAFTVSSAPAAAGGMLEWTTGNNVGLTMEVKSVSGITINLFEAMPYDIQIGDQYSVYRGCDKNLSTCSAVFANTVNFRGFPYIPGPDRALQYPDAK